jgi:hypothetical protein
MSNNPPVIKAYVIACEPLGVYLGNAMGMSFWTRLDTCGNPYAVAFATKDAARAHVASWLTNNHPASYRYVECEADIMGDTLFASIDQLKAAGLGPQLYDMEAQAAKYAELERQAQTEKQQGNVF